MSDNGKKGPAGTLLGNSPAKPPAPEPTHITLEEVADEPARPITEPQPLEPVMPKATEAQVQAALNRVAAKPATEPPVQHVGPVSLKPKKEPRKWRLIRIAGKDHELLHLVTGAIIVLFVAAILVAMIAALVNDSIPHRETRRAIPFTAHTTRLPAVPPMLICDEQSIMTVAADHVKLTGCRWSPPLPAGASPKTLYCDDNNNPVFNADGSLRFIACKPK